MKKIICNFFFVMFLTLLSGGCATSSISSMFWTEEDKAYIAHVDSVDAKFLIPISDSKNAWDRAQIWLSKYSVDNKIKTVTDVVIQTEQRSGFNYSVTRTQVGDKIQIEVECASDNFLLKADCNQRAKMLSYFIKDGINPPNDYILGKH